MGGDKLQTEDEQPPMCGGAVFNKFRPKSREKKEKSLRHGFRSFDQRPVMTESRSATSYDTTVEDELVSPEAALLNEHSLSRRGSRFFMFRKGMTPITEEPTYGNIDALRTEYLLDEPKFTTEELAPRESIALQFDPNDVNKLRSQHIKAMASKGVTPKPSMPLKSSLRSSSPRSPKIIAKEITTKDFGLDSLATPDTRKLGNAKSMKEVVTKQQEMLKVIASQNQYYRQKLGATQVSFHKVHKSQMTQADVIEKLQLEKSSFEAETLMLREEMAAIREQLALLQQQLAQTVAQKPSETNSSVSQNKELPTKSTPSRTTLTPANAARKTQSPQPLASPPNDVRKKHDSLPLKTNNVPIKTKDENTRKSEVASDPAQNYWKREWELSMKGMVEPEDGEVRAKVEIDENMEEQRSEISLECSKSAESSVDVPVRGVDPPELKRSPPRPVEYEKDMNYVHRLFEKYHNTEVDEKEEIQAKPSVGSEFDESKLAREEEETLVEIENMMEVDRVYSQRQEAMARMRALYESGEFDENKVLNMDPQKHPNPEPVKPTHQEKKHPHSPGRKESRKSAVEEEHSSRSQHSRVRFKQSVKEGNHNHMAPLYENQQLANDPMNNPLLPSMRLHEPTVMDQSTHSRFSSVTEQSDYGPVREHSTRSERSAFDARHEISQHTEATEYADYIEHSTSRHNAYLWAQSGRSERTSYAPRNEYSTRSGRSDHDSRHSHRSDVNDSVRPKESERSERTVAEVREPSQQGRKGATYKIIMTSPTHNGYGKRHQSPARSRGQEPSERSERSLFGRHAIELCVHPRGVV